MTNKNDNVILDTTDELVAAMTAVNACVDKMNAAEAEYHAALLALKEAGNNTTFKVAGKIFQVRTRKNKETGLPYPFLVPLGSLPSEWRKDALERKVAEAVAEIQAGTRAAPEITVEKISSDESVEVFAATGTDDVSIDVE